MAEPFLGEIRLFSFSFAPKGWALCNGQFLPINQNQALFALLGTMYGGNGQTTFALPNLQGRTPIHVAPNTWHQGTVAGAATHTLSLAEMPMHTHLVKATTNAATSATPGANVLAAVDNSTFGSAYAGPANLAAMSPAAVSNSGGCQPHNNEMPYLVLSFCIALQGIFPSRN